ncbi:SDR family NAD(P)-dependent oxidoreductase [Amycolatopsis thermoflava]|uniref:NAD(P)-dependent dehydrogenase (Short-subunit alcohol dehydrogenase family) n=1 Tax=Amycolatopsis thermoflava TaxID=84480 RepID=A0A3N2H6D5_9PSEU|nr:SDR family oxidoreductase [Amycolatopsis thermoflava]ROS44473.1 NAD(P)-dependent dehydrogenase (short-subunit alcohol dehydrogenase family) [Amycolatopsis thermoflava]
MPIAQDLFSLQGKSVLLTGATAGLGRRFAETLSEAGAKVAIVGRRAALLAEIAEKNPGCVPVQADLAQPSIVPDVVARATDAVGAIDVLVNNAAYIAGGVRAEDETPEDIDTTLNVNLVSPIRLAQAVFPAMKERGRGSIINVTSIVARAGIARFPQATYAASKGGLEAITREWAAQWARHGIRVNAIAPGFFESEMTSQVIHHEKVQNWILDNTLIPRHGTAADFDGALLYLASDASGYVTGQTLVVDGGWTAH